jgi:hypothetical protein
MGRFMLVFVSLVSLVGCEPPKGVAAKGSAPPPPPATGAGVEFVEIPSAAEINGSTAETAPDSSPVAGEPTSAPPTAPEQTAPPSQEQTAPPTQVQLSAGVALPQLLPEGTQLGVSVDYRVTGQLQQSSRYVLVVSSSEGEIAVEIELAPQGGTLQGFCPPSVRPEHKPFTARIEELAPGSRSRTAISNTASLATSY